MTFKNISHTEPVSVSIGNLDMTGVIAKLGDICEELKRRDHETIVQAPDVIVEAAAPAQFTIEVPETQVTVINRAADLEEILTRVLPLCHPPAPVPEKIGHVAAMLPSAVLFAILCDIILRIFHII